MPRPVGYIYGRIKTEGDSGMNKTVITYGVMNDHQLLLIEALSNAYHVTAANCTTDLIVTDAVCSVINADALSEESIRALLAYYMDVGDILDETVVWLGNVELPKLPSFTHCKNYLEFLINCKKIIRQAQDHYDTMQQYTDVYSYLPRHAIAECLEAEYYAALKCWLPKYPLDAARKIWMTVLELENGAELLAATCELCRWLNKENIIFRMSHEAKWQLFVLLFSMSEEGISYTSEYAFDFCFCKEDYHRITVWLKNHWYFRNSDDRVNINPVDGLESGIASIDVQIMGMRPGEVILVGGRPAMGKTSFARGVERHLTKQGKRVFYFDFVHDGKDVHKDFTDFERELRASEADFAVFDHFQFLLDYDETDETAEALFKKIKSLATELQIPIMVLIHLNKNPETRPDPSPVTTDIPHAERILPFVDTVLLLYRRAYYDPLVDRSTARCIIDKAKRCHCKVLSLRWDDENHRFTD